MVAAMAWARGSIFLLYLIKASSTSLESYTQALAIQTAEDAARVPNATKADAADAATCVALQKRIQVDRKAQLKDLSCHLLAPWKSPRRSGYGHGISYHHGKTSAFPVSTWRHPKLQTSLPSRHHWAGTSVERNIAVKSR